MHGTRARGLLELDGIGMHYPGDRSAQDVWALKDLNLTIEPGEFVAIIGPSGCGKTTLLQIAAGLRAPTNGRALIEGDRIDGPHPKIGVVFQEDSTFPWFTTQQNIVFSLKHREFPAAMRSDRASEMIRLVGLHGFESHYPDQLSGGMRQRVALARELAPKPKLLLLDEPFGSLDEQSRLILGDELLEIWRNTQSTVVLITHSINEAAMLADRVVVLSRRPGRVRSIVENPVTDRSSDIIGSPEFMDMAAELWSLLKGDASAAMRE